MKKIFHCFVVIALAGMLWGCAELDRKGESVAAVEPVQEAQEEAPSRVAGEAWHADGERSEVEPGAYYSCEGKRCGESCGPGGYVCDSLGQCKKGNPACD